MDTLHNKKTPRPKRNTSKLNQNENCDQNTAAAKLPGEQLSDLLKKVKL